jgi:hypothetical protein
MHEPCSCPNAFIFASPWMQSARPPLLRRCRRTASTSRCWRACCRRYAPSSISVFIPAPGVETERDVGRLQLPKIKDGKVGVSTLAAWDGGWAGPGDQTLHIEPIPIPERSSCGLR